jgi:hypothetical protein
MKAKERLDFVNRMEKMYLEEKKSCLEIADELGIGRGAVNYQLKRYGITMRTKDEGLSTRYPNGRHGSDAAHWKGGKVSNRGIQNYFYIHKPEHPHSTKQGYVMEHRLVMEEKLGRLLEPKEIVHHINGDGKDNRPENLELQDRSSHVYNHFAHGKKVMILEEEIRTLKSRIKELENQLSNREGYAC